MDNVQNTAEIRSGLSNEGSLHSEIKQWYARPGDRFEVRLNGYIVDILRDDHVIEIQTRNFLAIRNKLLTLCKTHQVRLVHPVFAEKWITRINEPGGEIIGKRRSPKKGTIISLFDELIRIPDLINLNNLTIEVLLIRAEEIWCQDGKGSWRRKGVSIIDRKLLDVFESVTFQDKADFLKCLPANLIQPFSNKSLALKLGCKTQSAGKVTYCLKKMGVIKEIGKIGNQLLFEVINN